MAVKAFEKGSQEWMMFAEYWELCHKHWIIKDKDEYWDAVIRDMAVFSKKYQKEPLARKLALAFLTSLEEKDEKTESDAIRFKGQRAGNGPALFRAITERRPYL